MLKNYYELLGLEKTASDAEIKSAYRKLAKTHHPDVNSGDEKSEEVFKSIGEAYSVLGDRDLKRKYDNGELNSSVSNNQNNNSYGFSFNFGNEQPNTDLKINIQISAEDSLKPYHNVVTYQKVVSCETCLNSGGEGKSSVCLQCQGTGFVSQMAGFFMQACPRCKGKKIVYEKTCSACQGFGLKSEQEQLSIDIDNVVVFNNYQYPDKGNQENSKLKKGSVFVGFELLPHKTFHFQNYGCIYTAEIDPVLLMIGGEIKVPTLDGKELICSFSAGDDLNQMKNLGEYGLNSIHGKRQDFLVNINLKIPKNLSEEEKSCLGKYLELSKEKGEKNDND